MTDPGEAERASSGPPTEPETQAPGASEVSPQTVSASSTAPPQRDAAGISYTYDPEKATDSEADTAWQVSGDGSGEYIQIDYPEEVTVERVGVIPGYDKVDPNSGTNRFYQRNILKTATLEFSDGSTEEATFEEDPRMQFTEVEPIETDHVRVTIEETYPAGYSWDDSSDSTAPPVDNTAISEVLVEGTG